MISKRRHAWLALIVVAVTGCGETKAPIMEDDSEAIRALKEAGAQVLRLPIPGGMAKGEFAVRVELDDVSVDSEIMGHLNAIPYIMELRFPNATDELLDQLGEFKALTKMDLSKSAVTDDGLKILASKSLPGLYTLMLNDTGITGAGLANLPEQVKGVTLENVKLQDADLENLNHIRGLTAVTLTGTGVSASAVNSFRSGRPGMLVMGVKLN